MRYAQTTVALRDTPMRQCTYARVSAAARVPPPVTAAKRRVEIVFTLEKIEDIFEIRVPRIQIMRLGATQPGGASALITASAEKGKGKEDVEHADSDVEKKALKREITAWFQNVAEYMDRLVCLSSLRKS